MKLPVPVRWRAAGGPRSSPSWRTVLLGAALFIPAFLVGFLLALPMAPLQLRLVDGFKQHGASVEIATLRLSPRLALEGERMSIRIDHAGLPPFLVERFSLRPLWWSLLGGEPGARIAAELLQGTLQADVHKGGRVRAQAGGLRFSLPVGDGTATVSGTLAAGRLERSGGNAASTASTLSLTFSDLQVNSPLLAGTASRPLTLGEVTFEAGGRGPVYTIARLESRGGDLTLTGSGTLLAGSSPENSRLQLALVLRPAPASAARLDALLALLGPPAGDGSHRLQVDGTLARPTVGPQDGHRRPPAISGNRNSPVHAPAPEPAAGE